MTDLPDVDQVDLDLDTKFDLIADLLNGPAAVRALVARGEHERAAAWRARVLDMVLGEEASR